MMGLLGLSSEDVRNSPFAKVTFQTWLQRADVVADIFRLASDYYGETLVAYNHPALPNRWDWPDPEEHAGLCGERAIAFHHCISSYKQAWYLQLFRKDDGFPTLMHALDVAVTKKSFRAGMEFIVRLLANGYCISSSEFAGATTQLADIWIRLGDDIFSVGLDFSAQRRATSLEKLQALMQGQTPNPTRALALFDWVTETLSTRIAGLRRVESPEDWILGLCEIKALAGLGWDLCRLFLSDRELTSERKATVSFIEELEADVGAWLGVFDTGRKLIFNPGAMVVVWELYRSRDSHNWLANMRRDRLALPDALEPIVREQYREPRARPEWPDHWVHFGIDFVQPLCHLRGGHAEIVQWRNDTVGSSAKSASSLPMCTSAPVRSQPRLATAAFKSVCPPERSLTPNATKLNFDRLRTRICARPKQNRFGSGRLRL